LVRYGFLEVFRVGCFGEMEGPIRWDLLVHCVLDERGEGMGYWFAKEVGFEGG